MPSMYEIYDSDAAGYDRLVNAEDYRGELRTTLRRLVDWRGARVVEAGVGTGRVTRCYVDDARLVEGFDRSQHMLDRARANLARWPDRVRLARAEHLSLPVADATADVFVEGWAFGHSVVDAAELGGSDGPEKRRDEPGEAAARVGLVAARLVGEAERVVRPGGTIIIAETLGTNVNVPAAPLPALAAFYRLLEGAYGFARETIRTDYRFASCEEAAEVCGFFFGPEMGEAVRVRGEAVVPEFTGVFVRTT